MRLRPLLEGRGGDGISRTCSLILRTALCPLGLVYGVGMSLRRAAYAGGLLRSYRMKVPVVSVGNLTVGGTGKTPFAAMLCRMLLDAGRKPGIISRGYGASDPDKGDEVELLRAMLPGVPVKADPDRLCAAEAAIQAGAEILVLDDGFQHLRLQRDLDVVLLDAACPWGGGLPLPAGMLREFTGGLVRAHVICLTHGSLAEQQYPGRLQWLVEYLERSYPDKLIMLSEHRPVRLRDLGGTEHALDDFAGIRVMPISGIGLPDTFYSTLSMLGAEMVKSMEFPDHHPYSPSEIAGCLEQAAHLDATLVTTAKDAIKLKSLVAVEEYCRIMVLDVDLVITRGRERLEQLLLEKLPDSRIDI